jgi:RNA polymerase sigma-70 factor (ECF subfamily)
MEAQWQAVLSDPISMERAEEAHSGALEAVVRDHARFVYKLAYLVVRNHFDAEDVTQETFVRVMKQRQQLHEIQDQRAWLARIAWRVAISRKRGLPEISLEEAAEPLRNLSAAGASAEELASEKQMAAMLKHLIDTLPAKLRDPLLLSLAEELSSTQVGKILGIPEGSVRTRLFRARQLLRQKLSSLLGGPDEQ